MKKIIKILCSATIIGLMIAAGMYLSAEQFSPQFYLTIISILLVLVGTYINNKDEENINIMLGLVLIIMGVLITTIDGGSKVILKASGADPYSPVHNTMAILEIITAVPCLAIMAIDFINYFKTK